MVKALEEIIIVIGSRKNNESGIGLNLLKQSDEDHMEELNFYWIKPRPVFREEEFVYSSAVDYAGGEGLLREILVAR